MSANPSVASAARPPLPPRRNPTPTSNDSDSRGRGITTPAQGRGISRSPSPITWRRAQSPSPDKKQELISILTPTPFHLSHYLRAIENQPPMKKIVHYDPKYNLDRAVIFITPTKSVYTRYSIASPCGKSITFIHDKTTKRFEILGYLNTESEQNLGMLHWKNAMLKVLQYQSPSS